MYRLEILIQLSLYSAYGLCHSYTSILRQQACKGLDGKLEQESLLPAAFFPSAPIVSVYRLDTAPTLKRLDTAYNNTSIYMYTYICIHIYVYIYMYTYTYINMYIHTHRVLTMTLNTKRSIGLKQEVRLGTSKKLPGLPRPHSAACTLRPRRALVPGSSSPASHELASGSQTLPGPQNNLDFLGYDFFI